jgi:hypothetical protein
LGLKKKVRIPFQLVSYQDVCFGTTPQNKHTSPNFETIKKLIRQKNTKRKFSQEAIATKHQIYTAKQQT